VSTTDPAASASLRKALMAIAHVLESLEEAPSRLARALDLLRSVVPYDHAALFRFEDERDPGDLLVHPQPPPEDRDRLEARLCDLRRLLGADETPSGPQLTAPAAPALAHLAIPLVGLGRVIGVLYVERPAESAYDEECVGALSIVAAQLGSYLTTLHLVGRQASAAQELAKAHAFQQQLVGIVSHDLRNPLAAITMSAALVLRREGTDAQTLATMERITSSANRADRIIRALLDGTRARLGNGIPIVRAPMDLDAVLRDAVDEARVSSGRTVRYDSSGPLFGAGDQDRLAQVASNLLGNALRYSPAETPVEVGSSLDAGGEAQFMVRNDGPAIPAALLPRIFDPFRRGAVGDTGSGLGLGLYIVREIVRGHGGQVEVQSSEARGTTFTVTLPGFEREADPLASSLPEARRHGAQR
jgi:signal transduction histidine kinase